MGSMDFIGNPVGLFSNIGSGLQDLINKPKEGFVNGPLEGGLGIIQGASSLIKNTLSGSLNTLNKISGSLGAGFVGLTLDEEYIKQR
jgi:vacuolar protein sorting-associated protein 13A/C